MQMHMSRVILYVRDVARLKDFYETRFGFPIIEEIPGEWAVLQAGQIELALHLAGPAYRAAQNQTTQSNIKLLFTIESGLAQMRAKLEEAGVSVGKIKRYSGFPYSLCDGLDPEGNVFQLSEPD